MGDFSPSKSAKSDPWVNPTNKTNKSPQKQGDIDNDEFFSQLTKPATSTNLIMPSLKSKSPEKFTSNNTSNDPWSSSSSNLLNTPIHGSNNAAQTRSNPVIEDLWLSKTSLEDPWSSKASTFNSQPKLTPAIIPSANNPWSNPLEAN